MTTALFTHPSGLEHDTGPGHPERIDRLRAVTQALEAEDFQLLDRRDAPPADREQNVEARVRLAQSMGDVPVCVGFGVSTPEHAEAIGRYADGVVVGSAIVDTIETAVFGDVGGRPSASTATAEGKSAAVEDVAAFIARLKEPLRA